MSRTLALIRVRGPVKLQQPVEDTLAMLNLRRKNACVIVTENPVVKGMINRVRDFITYGDIDTETVEKLKKADPMEPKEGKQKIYSLHPPRKGFGRKGIKIAFSAGGALGDRKEKINDLISRMMKNGSE